MHEGRIIFAQIMDYLPRDVFDACVKRYRGDHQVKNFSCRDQFYSMAFAQLTLRDGLRGIQESLRANAHCLYHMGFRCRTISRNTLAVANENRPWKIYADFALALMERALKLYENEPLFVELNDAKVFALDSTTIDLCLKRFPWTPSQQSKAAVKAHVLLNLRGNIPEFIYISDGKTHDVNVLDQLEYNAGAYYIMDRGYVDFTRLYNLHQQRSFFVTRAKKHMKFVAVKSRPVDKMSGLRCDQSIRLTGQTTAKKYPELLRRVKYRDPETDRNLVFLTNDFELPALMIAALYKQRWQVELFFKWIKQHLKIKAFYGYSENAVRTQIWIAMAVYCLLAIIKKQLGGNRDLHEIQEIMSVSIFQKMPINQAFSRVRPKNIAHNPCKQLTLFDLCLGQ
jgi:IS4 transposase